MFAIETHKTDILTQRRAELSPTPLSDGQIRVDIETLAVTANTVTYAVAGFDVGYWQFFPARSPDWGIVPAWGFAHVSESRAKGVLAGQRLYGFWPMAQSWVLTPEVRDQGLVDRATHRADLPAVYNHYTYASDTPTSAEPFQALLQPLAATSWLIADWLADQDGFGAQQVIVGSASSKTGLALCRFLADSGSRVIGLTGAGNVDFVRTYGQCDQVLSYDRIEVTTREDSVFVDMAGNADVKCRVHSHLGSALRHSAAVGLSHWDKFDPTQGLDGPKPEFFFAPAQIAKRREDWGPGVAERKIAQAVETLAKDAVKWIELQNHNGADAGMNLFRAVAGGTVGPQDGHIWTLGDLM